MACIVIFSAGIFLSSLVGSRKPFIRDWVWGFGAEGGGGGCGGGLALVVGGGGGGGGGGEEMLIDAEVVELAQQNWQQASGVGQVNIFTCVVACDAWGST